VITSTRRTSSDIAVRLGSCLGPHAMPPVRSKRGPLHAALQALQEDPQGRTAIQAYRDVPKYDELVGEAAAGMAAARELLAQSALSASEGGR
jgi:hypothetical protein